MAIDWKSYNVNSDERVQYIQPDSSSISLNRILSNQGSQIHGQIDANGHVILVNPNGIVFGQNATINVGGILASGLNIDPNDFMNGNFAFSGWEGSEGKVINSGVINASTGGSVSLLGKQVENHGLITANLGAVNLAAGKEAVITFDDAGLMGVRITREVLQDELGVNPAVINAGEITAESGRILLSGSVSEDIFTRAVNIDNRARSVVIHDDGSFTLGGGADVVNSGKINASTANENAGQIVMLGENVTSSGEIRAEGAGGDIEIHSVTTTMLAGDSVTSTNAMDGGKAGDIKILGRNVGAVDKAIVTATGLNGGGEVLIGGDEMGANQLVRNARFVYLGQGTNIFADATVDNNGGRIITFAKDTARVYGGLFARGGKISGDGGFIETSGLVGLDVTSIPSASARAVGGKSGEWLIDPYDVNIVGGDEGELTSSDGTASFESSFSNTRLGVERIITALSSTNVTIRTGAGGPIGGGNITVNTGIELPSSYDANSTLTLIAHNDIYLNGNIRAENGTLGIDLQASGDIELGSGYDLLSNGAPISFIGDNFTMERGGSGDLNTTIWSSGGTVDLNFTGHISIDTGEAANADSRARILTDGGALTISANTFSIGNSANNSSYLDTGGGALQITAEQINLGGFIVPASTPAATPIHEVTAILDSTNNTSAGPITLTGAINLIGDVIVDAASDGVDGTVTFIGDVTGNSQNLTINGGIINIGAVDLSGGADESGGELRVTGSGNITTGDIDTSGGISSGSGNGTPGQNGGAVDIVGDTITVGVIDASGADANDNNSSSTPQYDGGAGGTVELTSTTGAVTVGGINTDGGNGDAIGGETSDDASGGNAGNITISANGGVGRIYLGGDLTVRGGRLHEEAGSNPSNGIVNGDSGDISLEGQRIILTGDVTIDTTLVPETGLSSAVAEAEPTDLIFNGTIDGTNSGGQSLVINAGNVWFNEAIGSSERIGSLEIDATGRLDATGRNINATSFSSVSTTFDSSDINTAGDTDMEGGNITVDASGRVSIGNITTEAGVRSADGDGYSGGNVELAGSAITVGEINTNGGAARAGAGVNDGGNAGTINLTSQENAGEYSITLLGDVSAIGGAGENGGVEGSSQTANLDLVSGDGYGHVTLSPTQSAGSLLTGFFSSNINITANVGEGVSTLTGPAFFDETLYWNIAGDGAGTIDAAGDVPLDPVSTRVQFNGFSILNGSNASEVFRIGDNSYTLTITAADGSISEVVGPDSINIWDISDGGTTIRTAGQIGEPTISLFGFSRYTGNDQADTFDVNYGTFNGVLDGGEGSDRLVVWDNAGALVLVGSNTPGGAWINTLNVEHIEAQENTNSTLMVNGNGNSVWRLLADDVDGNTTLDGQNDGELQYNLVMDEDTDPPIATSTISFFNFSSLNGNAGNDDFLIEDSAIFTGSINGDFFSSGEGRDTLQSNNSTGSNEWSISSLMAGTLLYGPGGSQNQITFSNMHALTGGTATDTLRVIDDLASESGTWTVNASAPDTLSLTSDLDTKLEFDGIERLIGGSENDTFNIGDSIEYIDGGLGGDQFYVMAASIEAELVGGPQTGDSGDDVLVSHQESSNFWRLDGPNSGSVNTGDAYDPIALVTFSWVEELQGASGLDDVFEFTTPDQTAMEIFGGEDGGIDTVRYGFTDQPVTLVIAADGSDSTGVQGIENIVGNSFHESGVGTSTLMVTNAGPTFWEINAINGGEVEVGGEIVTFSNFPGLIGGAGDDQFTVTSGSITVIDGGSDGTDSIIGRAVDSEFNLGNNTDPHSGSVIALETAMPYVAEFSNIDSFTGNGDNDRLNATELDFNLTVDLGGNTGTLTLTGIETIDANVGNDNTLIGRNSSSTWSINPGAHTLSDSSGTIEFSNFNHLVAVDGAGDTFDINDVLTSVTGGNGADTFNIAASISNVYGGMGNDRFVLNANALATMLDGEGGTDYLTGFTTTSSWVINSSGSTSSISTGGVTTNFRGMDNLNGRNDVADTFKFNSFGSATGPNINAGGGETQDIVDYSDIDTALIIDIDSGNAFNGVQGAELLQGNSNHTLMASAGAAWRIYDFDGDSEDTADGANDGEVDGTQFVNFGNLRGGSGIDTFVFDGGTLSGDITGAGNNNTISRTVEGTTWEITGNDQGTFDDLDGTFSGISTLEGNAGADTFVFHSGSSWSGTVIGGDGVGEDVVESRHSASNIWNITGEGSGNISWLNEGGSDGFTGIETIEGSDASDTFNLRSGGSINRITGGSGSQDFIVALNGVANKWNITGDDAGNITNSDGSTTFVENFTGIENLTGNDEDDYFDVSLNANISGIIDGGETDNDTLDLQEYGPAVVNLDGEGVDGFNTQNIEVFLVDAEENNELTGGNVARDWYIVGENSVTINGRTYTGFSSLTGGNRNDNFIFQTGGSLTGRISGGEGGGTDSITGLNETITWRIDNNESGSIDSILPDGFFQIEELLGGDGQDVFHIGANVSRIMGGNGGDTFHVNSDFSGILNGEEGDDIFNLAAAVNLEVLGGAGEDTFNVSYYGSDLRLTGGADSDNDILTLAHSQAAEWELNGGEEEVTVGSASVFFSDIQIVNGSMGADTFDVTGNFDGAVNGRDGEDIFNLYASIFDGASGGAGENIFNILSESVVAILTGGDDVDTLALGHGGDVEWDISPTSGTITNQDDSPGQITFSGMENGEGSTGSDIFNLSASFDRLEGNTGIDVFNIDAPTVSATLVGSNDFSTLNINHGAESGWALNGGEEQVSTDDGTINFSSMEQLNGGSGADTFNVTGTFDSASVVNGRGGRDIFNLSAAVSASLNGGDENDTFNINSGMYSYVINGEGGDDDTLNIEHADNNHWIFDDDSSTVQAESASDATEFQLIEVVNGGAGVDNVDFYTSYAGIIDGRGDGDTYTIYNAGVQTEIDDSGAAGNDSLIVAHDEDTTWMIIGDDSSVTDDSAGSAVFSGMEIATGGNGADSFTITSSLLQVNGGGGGDQFLLSANVTNGVYGNDGDDVFTLLAEGLTVLLNGGADDDTLIGPDSTLVNDWQVSETNEGTLTNSTVVGFEEIENLTGGTGTDRFTLSADVEGDVNGAEGDDEFIINAPGYAYSINGGSGESDILRIEHSEDTWWTFDGSDTTGGTATAAGAVTSFSSIDSVQGGAGMDTVNIAGSFDGTVDGRDGEDRYLISETGVSTTIADSGVTGVDSLEVTHDGGGIWIIDGADNQFADNDGGQTGFAGIETVTGGDGADNFTITTSLLQVNGGGGPDEFSVGANVTNGIYGGDGNDAFALIAEGLSLLLNGGNDNDVLAGADSTDLNQWRITDANEGTLTNGTTIDFLEMENLTGGEGDDSYTFVSTGGNTGSLNGVIDGGDHIEGDAIDAVQLGGGLTVSMGDEISDINFVAIERIEVAEAQPGASGDFNEFIGNDSLNFWTFDGRNTGTLEDVDAGTLTRFIGFQNITGGDGADTFTLEGSSAGVDGTIDGAGQPVDSFDSVDFSGIPVAHTVLIGNGVNGITGVEGFTGYRPGTVGEGQDRTLIGLNYNGNIWTISDFDGDDVLADGVNDGRYQEGPSGDPISFVNFNRLVGGGGDDTFTFYGDATITGEIHGGDGGRNVIDADSQATPTSGRDLTAQLNGDIEGILNLQNIQSITANEGNTNTLIAGNVGASHTWTIDDDNSGNINGIEFANFANLTGSDAIADRFEFHGTATVSGLIDGGSRAGDTVDLTGLNRDFDIIVQIGAVVNDYLNVNNVESINANPLNNNQLIAANRANTWNMNGENEGNIDHTGNVLPETSIAFDGFENLTGGSNSDLFILDGTDNVTGLIDGGAGEAGDELRLTGLTRDITVVLDSRVDDVQSELNAIQFETISANGANVNTLVAGNDPNLAASTNNTWEIDAENEGRLNNTIDFIEFDNLIGGDTNDTFEFSLLGAITGYIDGGDESTEDVVDMSLLSAVSVTLGDGTNSLRDIERIVGNNRNSTLIADNIINEWNLASGINDGTVNGLVFTDFNQLMGGSERDTFTISGGAVTGSIAGAGGNDIVNLTLPELATGELAFVGGDQNDTLIISGGNDNYSATYSPDVAGESRLVYSDTALNSYTVRYRTTETIQDNVVANSLTINGSANAETITLANNNVVVDGFAQVNYDNKNNIVLAGAADDTVTIDGVVNVPGQLAIRNATVAANDDAMVVANSVLFNATGQVGSAEESLTLDTGNVLVRSANGDVYLENRDSVNIVELSTASRFDLVAAGQVSSNAALSSQGAVSITANNGNIELTNTSNAFQGPLTLNAANNNITLVNNSATDLAGIVSQTLNVTSGGAIVGSGPLLVNGLATFDSVVDVTLDNNNNDFSSVSVLNANDVVLVDRNQLTLANFDGVDTLTTQSNGLVVNGVIQSANVAINAQSGTANLNNAINSTGAVNIEANGIAANDTINAGSILLSDSAGGVNLTGVLRTNGGEIRINSDGSSVTQQGRISTSGGAITLNAANDIVMTGSAISESADGLISYSAGGNIDLTRIAAGEGTIAINSAGSVYDTQEGSADIIANRLEISSRTGISGTQIQSDFETDISELFVINNGGEVRISNAGTVRVDRLRSNGDVTLTNETGDIIFNNQPDNTYMRDETDALLAGGVSNANYDQGFIAITSNQGSILALGSADSSQPDIVGRGARLLAIRGEVGAGNRPLVLHVRDNLFIHGFRSLTPFWSFGTEPLDFNDASTIKVDLLDLINLSGEQLVEVEELEEVNPAIFTAVTNYFYDDVSIRLPNDQLYEDELEELTALD